MNTTEGNLNSNQLNADDYPEIRAGGARGSLRWMVGQMEHSHYSAFALSFISNSHRASETITDMFTAKEPLSPAHIKAAPNALMSSERVAFAISPRLSFAKPQSKKTVEVHPNRLPSGAIQTSVIHKVVKIDNDYDYIVPRQSVKPKRHTTDRAREDAQKKEELEKSRFVLIQPASYSEDDVARLWHSFLIKRLTIPISSLWSSRLWEYCKADNMGVKSLHVWSKGTIKAAYLCEPDESEVMELISEMGSAGLLDNLSSSDESVPFHLAA